MCRAFTHESTGQAHLARVFAHQNRSFPEDSNPNHSASPSWAQISSFKNEGLPAFGSVCRRAAREVRLEWKKGIDQKEC
jgi:hypothetical protein